MNNIKLRIHGSKLLRDEVDHCYFAEKIFSGYAYMFSEKGALKEILIIENGVATGVSHDILYPDSELLHIDEKLVTIEAGTTGGAICLYEGDELQGIVYEFDEDGMLKEETESNTENGAYRSWYKNGQVKDYFHGVGDSDSWYENGNFRFREFKEWRVGFDKSGKVNDIRISEETSEIGFNYLDGFQYSSVVKFSNQGVNDKVFSQILSACQVFVKKYEIHSTKLTNQVLQQANFDRAKEIILQQNDLLLPNIAYRLKKKYPMCRIVYNSQEIPADRIRINGEKVQVKSELYYHDAKLINGLIYDFDSHGNLFRLKEISQGRLLNTLYPDNTIEVLRSGKALLRMGARYLAVDSEHSNEKPERFILDDKPYVGVTYFFNQSGLLMEEAYYNPEKSEYRTYYPCGGIKESLDASGLQSWFEIGQIHEESFGPETTVYFNEDGTVYNITNLAEEPAQYKSATMIPGKELTFNGFGINDELVEQILDNEKLNLLSKITILNTNVTDSTLECKRISKLKTLELLNNDYVNEDSVEFFKHKHPACKVKFQ